MSTALAVGTTPWDFGNEEGLGQGLASQAERAEALGLHSLWLPEHHFGGSGAIPSPLLLLAAAASRTRKLRARAARPLGCSLRGTRRCARAR